MNEKQIKNDRLKQIEHTANYLHIEVVMSGVIGMEDELLNQVSCRVKQDILKNKTAQSSTLLSGLSDQNNSLQSYLLQTKSK